MLNCPYCGSPLGNGEKFCGSCGASLPYEPLASQSGTYQGPAATVIPEKKRAYSIACIVGFSISIFAMAAMLLWDILGSSHFDPTNTDDLLVYVVALLVVVLAFTTSLIISIIGLVSSRKKRLKGKGFGIVGIVVSAVGNAIIIVQFALAALLLGLISLFVSGSSANPKYTGQIERVGSYEVRMLSENDHSEALAERYFWDGDPDNTYIGAEILNGKTEITSYGGPPPGFSGPMSSFHVLPVEDRDYYDYEKYIESLDNSDAPQPQFDKFFFEPGTKVYFDEVVFTVYINEDVRNIKIGGSHNEEYLAFRNDDGSVTVYRYYLYFECSEENEKFYAKDGILYEKKSREKASVNEYLYKTSDDFVPYETEY